MENLFDIRGKRALVTGASSGLGAQTALALAGQGVNTAVTARREDRLDELGQKREAYRGKTLALPCDASDESQVEAAVRQVEEAWGGIDILVNCAGTALVSNAENKGEIWKSVLDVNLNGTYYFCREAGRGMIRRRYGKIINFGSINSFVAPKGSAASAYCASKGAVMMLTRELAAEWAKYNITVNAIGPGYFHTEINKECFYEDYYQERIRTFCPMERAGREGELNGAVIFLASDASSYVTGHMLMVDGGYTII